MTATQNHAPGTFCWVDLSTTDVVAAKRFYAAVFDWTAEDVPTEAGPPYTLLSHGGQLVCGAFALCPGQGDHPFWLTYVCVADLEATLVSAQTLGGSVTMPAMDIMEEGRLGVIQDPTGAHLGLWQPRRHQGSALTNAPGAPCWNELQTRDLKAAAAFYQGLFGWTLKPFEGWMDGAYEIFVRDGREVGGMLPIDDDRGQVPPHWSIYFGVSDCDAAVAKVEWLGGKVLAPATTIERVGRFARLQDPQSAVFSVIARPQG